jgi:hypothetical protein
MTIQELTNTGDNYESLLGQIDPTDITSLRFYTMGKAACSGCGNSRYSHQDRSPCQEGNHLFSTIMANITLVAAPQEYIHAA